MTTQQIDDLATKLAAHLPCTVASIADALRKVTADKPSEKPKDEPKK